MFDTAYTILGINYDATLEEIKSAYRKKVKENHPDLHPEDPEANEKMKVINDAYDMLVHPEKYQPQNSGEGSYSESYSYSYNDYYDQSQYTNSYYDDSFDDSQYDESCDEDYENNQYNQYNTSNDKYYKNTQNRNGQKQKMSVSYIFQILSNLFFYGLFLLYLIPGIRAWIEIVKGLIWVIRWVVFPVVKWIFYIFGFAIYLVQ